MTVMHYYSSADELIDFIEASSFGNFMRNVPDNIRPKAIAEIKKELEQFRTSKRHRARVEYYAGDSPEAH